MRIIVVLIIIFSISLRGAAQEDRDTVLSRCPVYITDTLTANNFFLEFQPSTIKVYRTKGKLHIQVQQKDQFFTIFFDDKKLRDGKYKIVTDELNNNEVKVKYSFRSGASASFVDVSRGSLESQYDKEKDYWHITINGMLTNLAASSVTYYKVRADFYIR